MVMMRERQKQRQQTAFGRAIAGIVTIAAVELADVVGDLALQKGDGVCTIDLQQAEMREVCQYATIGSRLQFGASVAKVHDAVTDYAGTLRVKKFLPFRVHKYDFMVTIGKTFKRIIA